MGHPQGSTGGCGETQGCLRFWDVGVPTSQASKLAASRNVGNSPATLLGRGWAQSMICIAAVVWLWLGSVQLLHAQQRPRSAGCRSQLRGHFEPPSGDEVAKPLAPRPALSQEICSVMSERAEQPPGASTGSRPGNCAGIYHEHALRP